MTSTQLNEHDANQGAQSTGEFLGMSGNSGWYLLGSGGAAIMIVILLWGVLGVSLLLCLFIGIVLCLISLTYVFTLKNNKPEHYDTDFFESALIESGLLSMSFGPRYQRPPNPFATGSIDNPEQQERRLKKRSYSKKATPASPRSSTGGVLAPASPKSSDGAAQHPPAEIASEQLDELNDELEATQALLDDEFAEPTKD